MSTRDEILRYSIELFNQSGHLAVGVREIARGLGISPGNLSYHFARKEDIIQAHLRQFLRDQDILIAVYLREEEDLHRFLQLLKQCMERQWEYRGLFRHPDLLPDFVPETGEDNRVVLSQRIQFSISKLSRQGQLQTAEEDISFLGSLINFQMHYWLSYSFLEIKDLGRDVLVAKYLLIVTRLLLNYASPNGRINILRFKSRLMSGTSD